MSKAGSETARSTPCASVIEPRRAGSVTSASCWVTAARLSVPAFTTPSQAAFVAPRAKRAKKVAKSRPMRRSISRTGLALAGGRGGAGVGRAVAGGECGLGGGGAGGCAARGRARRCGGWGGGRGGGGGGGGGWGG